MDKYTDELDAAAAAYSFLDGDVDNRVYNHFRAGADWAKAYVLRNRRLVMYAGAALFVLELIILVILCWSQFNGY